MNAANPLEQLRDIHLPEAVSDWPPAPGWWILVILLLSLLVWTGWKLWKNYQQKKLLRVSVAAIAELQQQYAKHQDPQLLVRQYSSLLRRIALARFPRQQVASLTGSHWLDFLNTSGGANLFNNETGQLLLQGPYQKPGNSLSQIEDLTKAIQLWIKGVSRD